MSESTSPILLYDGVCGLCNRLVQFVLRHDREDQFRFASLQSPIALEALARHGESASDLNTFYVALGCGEPEETLLARSEAVGYVLRALGGRWRVCGRLWMFFPQRLRDAFYNLVARNRYRIFGKLDICPVPDPRHRGKFLDGY